MCSSVALCVLGLFLFTVTVHGQSTCDKANTDTDVVIEQHELLLSYAKATSYHTTA